MKRLSICFLLLMVFISCTYDEVPGGKAVVQSVRSRKDADSEIRMYIVELTPLKPMKWVHVRGMWNNTKRYILYTDSLVTVGDTITILK